jgi:hypothetical protein
VVDRNQQNEFGAKKIEMKSTMTHLSTHWRGRRNFSVAVCRAGGRNVIPMDAHGISITQQLASAPKSIRAEFQPRPSKLGIANNIFMVEIET